jgi:hypothetical protein
VRRRVVFEIKIERDQRPRVAPVLGQRALVMPTVAFAGYLPPATIAKSRDLLTHVPRRD